MFLKPTMRPVDGAVAASNNLTQPISNNTELNYPGHLLWRSWLEIGTFSDESLDPAFLDNVISSVLQSFISQVIDIWPHLTRKYLGAANCTGCLSCFILLNPMSVVPGARFLEAYYWDSYWIIVGLLQTPSTFTENTRDTIGNVLDRHRTRLALRKACSRATCLRTCSLPNSSPKLACLPPPTSSLTHGVMSPLSGHHFNTHSPQVSSTSPRPSTQMTQTTNISIR